MKRLVKTCIGWIVNILYFILYPFIYINSKLYPLRLKFYSCWIGRRYNLQNPSHDVYFSYPINKIVGGNSLYLSENIAFGKFAVITVWDQKSHDCHTGAIKIGANCNFGDYLHLTCVNRIEIGENVLTGRWVTISDNNHGSSNLSDLTMAPLKRRCYSKGPVVIGDNVWIGDKATVLSGVSIGEGAIIGAGAVISKDIPPYSVAVGNPAKIILQRHP